MKTILTLISVILICTDASALLRGRESGGGGGNSAEAEFRRFAEQAAEAFFERQVITLMGKDFNHKVFRTSLKNIKLTATDQILVLNGKKVSAINYPQRNEIVFNQKNWMSLQADTKMQLVIHEMLGLKYRGVFDDSDYAYSQLLLVITKNFTVESVALSMARAGHPLAAHMRIIPTRTRVVAEKPDELGLGNFITTEVAIQTFENGSKTSVRVYHVTVYDIGGVTDAKLVATEGAAGG